MFFFQIRNAFLLFFQDATIEWWYQDFQKTVSFKIYPVFPPVRPTAHRFMTSVLPTSQNANETDIIDVSILLRHINVDDKGIYRCVIRSWSSDRFRNMDDNPHKEVTYLPALTYHVHSTGSNRNLEKNRRIVQVDKYFLICS